MPGEGRGLSSRPTQDVVRDLEIGQPSNSEKRSDTADGVTRQRREVLSESAVREIRLLRSMSVAPCKRVELSRLRWRRRQSLASSRVPSLAWRPVTAAAKRRQGGCRPEHQ